ncbi:MAG: hypothetical protein J6A01_11220, partial [Proteobacteria bacterium]|nr:hypothetical protein [Pseudomonadota bacterium]
MASHKILSVIFTLGALMLANAQGFAQTAPATAQDAAKQNRMQSDFNTMTVLLNACEQRTMTPDQYQSSCTGLANALQQEGITNDEENAQIYAFIQNSTQRCRVVQYYYNQTEAANAAFRSGQISADTLRTMHDAALRILLDSNYITQETYAQKLAELNVQIAQYQQQTAANPQQVQAPQTAASPQQVQAPQTAASPQQVQAPQTAASPQQVQAPQTAANPQQVQAPQTADNTQQTQIPQTSYDPQQQRIFQSTVAQQQEYANQAMLFQRYQELYIQTFDDYYQNRISEDELRSRIAELFDTMVKVGMLTQEQRAQEEATNE